MVFPLLGTAIAAIANFTLTEEVLALKLDNSTQGGMNPAEGKGSKSTTFCGNIGFRAVDGKPIPGLDYLKPETIEHPPNGQLK